jgi:hypothetical protein
MAVYPHATHAQISATLPQKTGRSGIWLLVIGGAVLAMAVLGIIAYAIRPQPFHCTNAVQCGTAPPLKSAPNPLPPTASYTSSTYGFSVEYPSDFAPIQTTSDAVSWGATYNGSPATWTFVGESAKGRTPQQVVNDLQQSRYPNATFVYAIPGANLGYTPGYGAVYNLFVDNAAGQSAHQRLIILSAIRGDVAVSFYGTGPFVQTSQSADGHPNPSDTPIVHETLFRQSIEGVTWSGEPQL